MYETKQKRSALKAGLPSMHFLLAGILDILRRTENDLKRLLVSGDKTEVRIC